MIKMVFGVWKTRSDELANVVIADTPVNNGRCFDSTNTTGTSTYIKNFLGPVTICVVNRETILFTLVSETILVWFHLTINAKLDINSGHRDSIMGRMDINVGQDAKIGRALAFV